MLLDYLITFILLFITTERKIKHTTIKDKQNICYIFPKEIKLVDENNNALYGTDYDGVEVFNGVRCESIIATKEEQEEMKNMLKEFE